MFKNKCNSTAFDHVIFLFRTYLEQLYENNWKHDTNNLIFKQYNDNITVNKILLKS